MPIPFSVALSKREIIQSGSLVLTDGNSVTFRVADLAFRLVFETTDDKKPFVSGEAKEKEMVLSLRNFDNVLGTAWDEDVGIVNGRSLHIALYIHALTNETTKTKVLGINYTFSLGEVVGG